MSNPASSTAFDHFGDLSEYPEYVAPKVIALSRSYVARTGVPFIREVAADIFTRTYFTHCTKCTFCAQQCCSYGVDVDAAVYENLKTVRKDVERITGRAFDSCFTGSFTPDAEYPGGGAHRSIVVDGRCVFLNRANGLCNLHALAIELGRDYHELKPLISALFPLTFGDGLLLVTEEVMEKSLACLGDGPSLYDGVRSELEYYFGDAFVAELDAIKAKVLAG